VHGPDGGCVQGPQACGGLAVVPVGQAPHHPVGGVQFFPPDLRDVGQHHVAAYVVVVAADRFLGGDVTANSVDGVLGVQVAGERHSVTSCAESSWCSSRRCFSEAACAASAVRATATS